MPANISNETSFFFVPQCRHLFTIDPSIKYTTFFHCIHTYILFQIEPIYSGHIYAIMIYTYKLQ